MNLIQNHSKGRQVYIQDSYPKSSNKGLPGEAAQVCLGKKGAAQSW